MSKFLRQIPAIASGGLLRLPPKAPNIPEPPKPIDTAAAEAQKASERARRRAQAGGRGSTILSGSVTGGNIGSQTLLGS